MRANGKKECVRASEHKPGLMVLNTLDSGNKISLAAKGNSSTQMEMFTREIGTMIKVSNFFLFLFVS